MSVESLRSTLKGFEGRFDKNGELMESQKRNNAAKNTEIYIPIPFEVSANSSIISTSLTTATAEIPKHIQATGCLSLSE